LRKAACKKLPAPLWHLLSTELAFVRSTCVACTRAALQAVELTPPPNLILDTLGLDQPNLQSVGIMLHENACQEAHLADACDFCSRLGSKIRKLCFRCGRRGVGRLLRWW